METAPLGSMLPEQAADQPQQEDEDTGEAEVDSLDRVLAEQVLERCRRYLGPGLSSREERDDITASPAYVLTRLSRVRSVSL